MYQSSTYNFSSTFSKGSDLENFIFSKKEEIDYYPFGMLMPNRHTGNSEYKFGFGGMLKDNEINGENNSYNTPFRQYDPRIARWLSLDLIVKPWESRYASYKNNPIYFTDPLGLDPPERLNVFQRAGNWLIGNGYKNKANKYAVDNNVDESRINSDDGGISINTLKYVPTETKYDDNGVMTDAGVELVGEEVYFKDKVSFKSEAEGDLSLNVNFGVRAGVVKAQANFISFSVISGKGSYSGEDGWDGEWNNAFTGEVRAKSKFEIKVKSPFKGKGKYLPEVGAFYEHKFQINSYGEGEKGESDWGG